MSHDQRPGKLRVVRDAASANGTRRGDPAGATDVAARAGTDPASGTDGSNAAAAGKSLPILQAGIFLLACVIGGVAVVIIRPF